MNKYVKKTAIIFMVLGIMFIIQADGKSYASSKKRSLASKVPRISAIQAYAMFNANSVVLVDSMNPRTYAKYHILGAINLSGNGKKDLNRIKRAKLPIAKNKVILVYCD